jgi:hypothetical protein
MHATISSLEAEQATMAIMYILAPLQPTVWDQVNAARSKIKQLLAIPAQPTSDTVRCTECGHEDPCGGGVVADSENVHCCRCSDRICWRLVSNERLEALDVRLALFVSEEGRVYSRDGWLGLEATHARSLLPTFAHCVESPLTSQSLASFLPVGMPSHPHDMIWDSASLGRLCIADIFAVYYQKRQREAAELQCTQLVQRVGVVMTVSDLKLLLVSVHQDRIEQALLDSDASSTSRSPTDSLIAAARAGLYPQISYQGGGTGNNINHRSHWAVDSVMALRNVLQHGTWCRHDEDASDATSLGVTDILLGCHGTWSALHMDNMNALALHLVVQLPKATRPTKVAKRQLSDSQLQAVLSTMARASEQLRDAIASKEAFSVWLVPTHTNDVMAAYSAIEQDMCQGCTAEHAKRLGRLVTSGALYPCVAKHGAVVILTQGCPHAVLNVVPDRSQIMLKVATDYGRWSELPRNCAMRQLAPLGIDLMACSLAAWRASMLRKSR